MTRKTDQNGHHDLPAFAKTSHAAFHDFSSLLKEVEKSPVLWGQYKRARAFRRITRKACNYDLTSRCNLFCEGCFYFEGEEQTRLKEETSLAAWGRFFAGQAERGIRYGYYGGAEAALTPERLEAAAKHIPRGNVSTNGTIPIDPDLPYTLLVSVWGDEEETEKFRGGGTFRKSIKLFAKDPRARFIYTVNRNNLKSVPDVAHILHEEGARFAFNYYSPTGSYLEKIRASASNDKTFFRISGKDYHLHFEGDDLLRAHDVIEQVIADYPQSCIHAKAFNDWMTEPGPRYEIDEETGVAVDCSGRNNEWHQAYGVDMKPSTSKCCTPNVECSDCRLHSPALSTVLFQHAKFAGNLADFRNWLDICEQWGRLFLLDDDPVWQIKV